MRAAEFLREDFESLLRLSPGLRLSSGPKELSDSKALQTLKDRRHGARLIQRAGGPTRKDEKKLLALMIDIPRTARM
jgi:hypothetical protein